MPLFRERFETLASVKDNKFHTWLYLLASGYKDEEEMNVLAEMSEGLKNFAQKYNIAINDPNLVRLYRLELAAIRDEKSRMSFAVREAHRANAIKLKVKSYLHADIAEITELSINEIMIL
ncbi:MAG: hypothetical protein IJ587_02040 [Synergistaceae bacterium]|nr:hypothetical protein [Synergistaceae bacterium]